MTFASALSLDRVDQNHAYIAVSAFAVFVLVAVVLLLAGWRLDRKQDHTLITYAKSLYAMFLKPHKGDGQGQQSALESFYKTQVGHVVIRTCATCSVR